MKDIIPNSYSALLQQAEQFPTVSLPKSDELLKHLGFKGISLHTQAPIFFVADYAKRKYLYIDPSCKTVLGYDLDFLSDAGPAYFTGLWNKDDFRIFNENIFPEILNFFQQQHIHDYCDYSFSFNYRIKTSNGNYLAMLQRSTYFVEPRSRKPLAVVGFIIDITHFKEGTSVIFTIERIDRNFYTLSKTPVLKKTYFPEACTELSKREMQIIQLMREGLSSKQIADKLFVSINTINNHRQNMLAKTCCKNTAELISFALQKGLFN